MNELIQVFDDGLDGKLVQDLIDLFRVSHNVIIDEEWRRCASVTFPDSRTPISKDVWNRFRHRAAELLNQYKERLGAEAGGRVLHYCNRLELGKLFQYLPGEPVQFFHPHSDSWNPDSVTRQVSFIGYLNDVWHGGETYFPLYDKYIRPRTGRVVLYPSNYAFFHTGLPPISNSKLIVVTWYHFGGERRDYETFDLYE